MYDYQLRVHDGFILYLPYIYYVVIMRLVYDYYMIHISCLSLRYRFGKASDKGVIIIATVFPVNPVIDYQQYGEYGIYGIYLLYLV